MDNRILQTKRPLWEVFPEFTKAIMNAYQKENKAGHGHGFMHVLMVAQFGPMFTEEKRIGILVWITGLIHDIDWIFPDKIEKRIWGYLSLVKGITKEEKRLILEAVMNHMNSNSPKDNPVTVLLKDCDRLGNIGVICPFRTAQAGFELPLFNPKPTEGANFRDVKTLLDSMRITLEWIPMLRCKKAKKYAKKQVAFHLKMIEELGELIEVTGISKFPYQL